MMGLFMKELIRQDKKIKVVALGCGAKLPELLMGGGSSQWLIGINLLYDTDAIDEYTTYDRQDSKYVSKERVESIMFHETSFSKEDTLTFVISASLAKGDQRDGRENHFWASVQMGSDKCDCGLFTEHVTFKSSTRDEQEQEIVDYVENYVNNRMNQSRVIYSGSFNPFHEGHKYVLEEVATKYCGEEQITVDMSNHHPEKGVISDGELARRVSGFNTKCDYVVDFGNRPKYIDKYHYYRGKFGNERLLFVIGSDVWRDYGPSFTEDFKNYYGTVQFLVVGRTLGWDVSCHENEKLLHPDSFKFTGPNVSSTDIRIEYEKERFSDFLENVNLNR